MIDLLVVGDGPVGLVTAIDAASRGLSVTVVRPRESDGDKACGEGLMPSAVAALTRLGVDPPGSPIRGIRYVRGEHRAQAAFSGQWGRGVRRTTLVSALRERADHVGVGIVTGRVTQVDQYADHVEAGGHRARYVAVADGLHSPLRRRLGLEPEPRPDAPWRVPSRRRDSLLGRRPRYGLRRHVALAPWTDMVEVHWADDCEAYVTPVGPNEVGVAVLCHGGAPFDSWLARFPELTARLDGAAVTSRVRGAGPLRQRATARVSGRVMLVGDAAGYVDALTGEGMAVGFASASELVQCVLADQPEQYEAAWRRVTRRPRLVTETLLATTQVGVLRRALVPAAQRMPGVFGAAVHTLA
jgi:flavin-dependent dehydrogenase